MSNWIFVPFEVPVDCLLVTGNFGPILPGAAPIVLHREARMSTSTPLICPGCKAELETEETRLARRKTIAAAQKAAVEVGLATTTRSMADAAQQELRANVESREGPRPARVIVCASCQTVTTIPYEDDLDDESELDWIEDSIAESAVDPVFQRDKFLLHQKHFSINTRYAVCNEAGKEIMHVVRPTYLLQNLLAAFAIIIEIIVLMGVSVVVGLSLSRSIGDVGTGFVILLGVLGAAAAALYTFFLLSPKRHITFYRDVERKEKILQVTQDQKVTLRMMQYTVLDATGKELGRFRKDYLANFLRTKWDGFDSHGKHLYVIREDELILALLRRFVGSIFSVLPTNFVIHQVNRAGQDGPLLGEFNRKFTLLDRYVLDCSHDQARRMDRRMAIAIGVLLDTGESR